MTSELRSWPPLRASSGALSLAIALTGCGESPWTATGAMITPRAYHTATALDNGQILLAGGTDGAAALAGIELYDPQAGVWLLPSAASQMVEARLDHTATFFRDAEGGHVLLVGGRNGSPLKSAEIYDTDSGVFSRALLPLLEARSRHTATLLDGHDEVLVAGGEGEGGPLRSAVLFALGAWFPGGTLNVARAGHTATLLSAGAVLIAGGSDGEAALGGAEIYDPDNREWTETEDMKGARACHTATLLGDGRVLVVGGRASAGDCRGGGGALGTAEIYDPDTGTWCQLPEPMTEARAGHTATLLDNGMVLIAGGEGEGGPLDSAELYDPRRPSEKNPCECDCGSWASAGQLHGAREGHTAARLPDGSVLVAGGMAESVLGSAGVYEPGTQCRTVSDCPASLVCDAQKQCVPPEVVCGQDGEDCKPAPSLEGSCSASAGGAGGAGALLAGMAAFMAALSFRRARGRARRGVESHPSRHGGVR